MVLRLWLCLLACTHRIDAALRASGEAQLEPLFDLLGQRKIDVPETDDPPPSLAQPAASRSRPMMRRCTSVAPS